MKPELLNTIKTYNSKQFLSDAIAGIIVGIVALPLAIAFAIASGVNPSAGIYTAIIAGFCFCAVVLPAPGPAHGRREHPPFHDSPLRGHHRRGQ